MKRSIITKLLLSFAMVMAWGLAASAQGAAASHLYAYKNGTVVFRASTAEVDSIALENNKTVVALYKHGEEQPKFTAAYADIDSISLSAPRAKADLLDIRFGKDGSCWDASPMGMAVTPLPAGGKGEVDFNDEYNAWESHFYGTSYASAPKSTVFKVDYQNNTAFKNGLADGHSWECLFRVDYDGTLPNNEGKFFAAHEGGGTGFLICRTANGKNGGNEVTFLPNVSTNGKSNWVFTPSGVVPESGKYYHIVGVWNKEEGKSYIYVNGQLMNTVTAQGNLNFPPSTLAQWVGVGCDANVQAGGNCVDSHIVLARIYGKALTQSEVDGLWEQVAQDESLPVADLLDVQFQKDGSAIDASPMKNTVETVSPTGKIDTYYNGNFGSYSARIVNPYGEEVENTKTYYKVDFENNQAMRDALADGHSIESLWKVKYDSIPADRSAKPISATQNGGAGLIITKQANGKDGKNEIGYLVNATTTGKSTNVYAASGVVPASDVYYHVVGVWNKEQGKAYIYVNGELKNTVDAPGEFRFAKKDANWWGIGCDSHNRGGEAGADFEIVSARIYGDPLTASTVRKLWNKVADATAQANDSVAAAKHTGNSPKANLIDIQFGEKGAVRDLAAPSHKPVWKVNGATWTSGGNNQPVTFYNSDLDKYVAYFNNDFGAMASKYVQCYDYTNDKAFQDSLADGHTLEAIVMQDHSDEVTRMESKPFSSHQAGGTGLMMSTTGDLTFLPYTGGAYRWARSGVMPKVKKYYHVVGVYDKKAGKAYVYVDGKLKSTVDAPGDFRFASSDCMRFTVGADPDASAYKANNAWVGAVVYARAYGQPLTAEQVRVLYAENVTEPMAKAPHFVDNVSYNDGKATRKGAPFVITGTGFKDGDKIAIVPGDGTLDSKIEANVTVTATGAEITLPENIVNDKTYAIYVERGGQLQTLGLCKFYVVEAMPRGARVIAHRGHWNVSGASENSRASLRNAIDVKCYGSETDVWLTTDGTLMVNHDPSFKGVTIQNSTAAQCKALSLSNGEKMPELKEFLDIIAAENWTTDTTKLIIEVKNHSVDSRNTLAGQEAVRLVKEAGLQDRVEYISFSLTACRAIHAADPDAKVAYLTGNLSPQTLHGYGITGLDYTLANYRNNPTWVNEARALGMTTNVWTLDDKADMMTATNMGIDFITTNNPVDALNVQKQYDDLAK